MKWLQLVLADKLTLASHTLRLMRHMLTMQAK
jgi:hypothetical protein